MIDYLQLLDFCNCGPISPIYFLISYIAILALLIEYGHRRYGLTRIEYIKKINHRTTLVTSMVLKSVSKDTKMIYSNNYIDSFLINLIYGFALTLLGGWIIYVTNIVYNFNINESLFLLITYFVIELRMLFYIDAIRDPDHLLSWRSLPTVGIIATTPIVFLYVLAQKRKRNLFSIEGLLNVWATTRYNILNPRWLRPTEDSKIIIGGSREKIHNPFSKRAPCIYKWLDGVFQ